MKKLIITSAVLFAFFLTSCKKDYTCVCTETGGGYSASTSATFHTTKKKAKDACTASASSAYGYTWSCELK